MDTRRTWLAAVLMLGILAGTHRLALHYAVPIAPATSAVAQVKVSPVPEPLSTQPDSIEASPAAPEPSPPKPQPWHFVSSPTLHPPLVMHRYVGTIDDRAATAELQWYSPDSISGRFYIHGNGPEYTFWHLREKPGPVVLRISTDDTTITISGQWRILSRLGAPVLKAIWQQGKRRHRVELRENYAGAVRYGIRTVQYTDDARGSLLHDFFTLPDPATVSPLLRPQLNPSPKARLRQLTQVRDSLVYARRQLLVRLNDCDLFSYQLKFSCESNDEYTVCGPGVSLESFLFDLTNGRPLTVASQLRPGYEKPLRRLLARHLSPDFVDICLSRYLVQETMPDAGLCLTGSGLEGIYEGPVKCGAVPISVPYRELRPLVRPGTPLARMLQARRMW